MRDKSLGHEGKGESFDFYRALLQREYIPYFRRVLEEWRKERERERRDRKEGEEKHRGKKEDSRTGRRRENIRMCPGRRSAFLRRREYVFYLRDNGR